MAVEAHIMNMGLGPCTIPGAQDCLMGSGFGVQDGAGFLPGQQRMEMLPVPGPPNVLAAVSPSSSSCSSLPLDIVQSLACELERQRVEMDRFLQLENQRLRSWILVEESRQRRLIMQKYESRMKALMLQKDLQVAAAKNRARELRNSLQVKEMEARTWRMKATEKEATASHLRSKLETAQQLETASFHGSSKPEKEAMRDVACRLCRARSLCSVFLPCRHLCCCSHCEALLGHCPVCGTPKEASVEVFLGS